MRNLKVLRVFNKPGYTFVHEIVGTPLPTYHFLTYRTQGRLSTIWSRRRLDARTGADRIVLY